MRRDNLLLLIGSALLLAILGLTACGGNSQRGPGTGNTGNPPGGSATDETPAPDAARNVLRLSSPALATLAAGGEFEVALSADTVEPLYQASARLLFDPAQLEPLSATTGDFGTQSVSLARADRLLRMDGRGYVPFSFTGLPGSGGLAPARHELLRVRFRVLAPLTANGGLRLNSDPAYLQLRAPDGRRLSFDLSEEVAAR